MTREEAKRRLLNIERCIPNTFRTKEDVRNFEALEMAIQALEQEPKTGHWIRYKENCCYNKCSICEYEHCKESNYCPNCGARMESEE